MMAEDLSTRMAAIEVEGGKGDARSLRPTTVAVPPAANDQLLIAVRAAGVNRPDIFQRLGFYPPPPGAPDTLGLEVAGEVVRAAGRWKVGDRVCALLGGGGYAQFAACDPRHALAIPGGLSFVEAASLPETVFTVFANVFELGGLKSGETLLVHGATSGIGVAAIQMAKASDARVFTTSRGADKKAQAAGLGADLSIDAAAEDFGAVAKQAGGVDVILDMIGGDYFPKDLEALKHRGRIVYIAALAGGEVTVPVLGLMQKQASISGSTLRGRNADEKARLAREIERVVWPWIADGRFRPIVDAVFPLDRAAEAHERMEAGHHVGKIVLEIGA